MITIVPEMARHISVSSSSERFLHRRSPSLMKKRARVVPKRVRRESRASRAGRSSGTEQSFLRFLARSLGESAEPPSGEPEGDHEDDEKRPHPGRGAEVLGSAHEPVSPQEPVEMRAAIEKADPREPRVDSRRARQGSRMEIG